MTLQEESGELLRLEGVARWFRGRRRRDLPIRAVDGIDLTVRSGEILGLVGESGSGKSTLGELVVGLQQPSEGRLLFDGHDLAKMRRGELKAFRSRAQMVFQDPYGTLNPRFSTWQTVSEPVTVAGIKDDGEVADRVRLALSRSGLPPDDRLLKAYPHELSGGQRQRVAIARAIVMEPSLVVADEPVSMLDVSIRSGILNLLRELRDELGLTILYISHDLASVHYICDRIAIMYLGKVVETGASEELVERARHPYTRALLASVPSAESGTERRPAVVGDEAMSSVDLPPGCRFAPRCPHATEACSAAEPELEEQLPAHAVRCIHPQTDPMWSDEVPQAAP